MTTVRLGIAVLATSLVLVGCGDDDDSGSASGAGAGAGAGAGGVSGTSGAGASGSPCNTLCERVVALDCPGDNSATCTTECEQMWAYTPCAAELRAMMTCMEQVPQSEWECDAGSKEAETKVGFCDEEKAAAESCLATSP